MEEERAKDSDCESGNEAEWAARSEALFASDDFEEAGH